MNIQDYYIEIEKLVNASITDKKMYEQTIKHWIIQILEEKENE